MTRIEESSLGPSTKVLISPSVYARAFGAELVLLDFGRGEYFGLDELGAEVWRSLEAGEPLSKVVDDMVATREVDREQALRDLLALVSDMRGSGLITVVATGAEE